MLGPTCKPFRAAPNVKCPHPMNMFMKSTEMASVANFKSPCLSRQCRQWLAGRFPKSSRASP
eukprot:9537539-Lingulodinium_polyedra.AAC.1